MLTYKRLLIMVAVDILGDRSYGNNVAGLIMNTTGRHDTLKTGVYVMLHRLVDLGYVQQWKNVERHSHGKKLIEGRPFYSVTRKGRNEVEHAFRELDAIRHLANKALRKGAA